MKTASPILPLHAAAQVIKFLLVLVLANGCFAATARADLYSTNLLLNPGAELASASTNGEVVVPIANWATAGGFTAAQYGSASGVLATCPGPADRGTNFFAGGPTNALSSAWQDVDVSSAAGNIDSHSVVCTLAGWLGGYSSTDDNARLAAYFLTIGGQTNGSLNVGPVLSGDRTNVTGFVYRQGTARLPTGTRAIRCQVLMTRSAGSYNDGYADSLSLMLSNSPPPPVLLGTNLLANPGAEAGPGSVDGTAVEPVPGWTTTGNFTVDQYGAAGGVLTNAVGANCGSNYFAGGSGATAATATQELDVSTRWADIDSGSLACTISGWLGGWLDQNDNARFTAYSLSAGGQTNGSVVIGPVLAADRTNQTAFLFRQAVTNIPPGTRIIRSVLSMTWAYGSFNDGYADNLSLALSYSSAAPHLTIAISGNSALVSWPLSAVDWTLQSTPNLAAGPAVWAEVLRPYHTNGNTVARTVSGVSTQPRQFFRLTHP